MRSTPRDPQAFAGPRRPGLAVSWMVALLAVLVVGATLVLMGGGGGTIGVVVESTDIHTVERADFEIMIPASGELITETKVEIRNLLEGRAVITEVVDEGSFVRKGDIVLRLADEELVDKIKDAEDKVQTAESSVVAAEQSLAIRKSTMASDLEKADLEIEIANLDLKAWEEGGVVTQRQKLDLDIETARINRDRSVRRAADAENLLENGWISFDEFESDRIAMIEAEAMVKEVELAKTIYENYTIKQEEATKRSAVEQSRAEKGRVRQRHEAEIVKIEADVESVQFKRDTANERLADLQEQLKACVVEAPSDGLVVFASSLSGERRGRDNDPPPQVGTELRQNELVMILPDTNRMIANLKVSEALSGRIKGGQPATIFSDSSPGTPIAGVVQGVSVLAESGGWRDPNRRDYTVRVLLDADPALGLKPSMRCRGEIILGQVEDVITTPIQSVFRSGPLAYVYTLSEGGFAQTEVRIGRASEMEVEIVAGLAEGDDVLLRRPTAGEKIVSKIETKSGEGPFGGGRPGPPAGRPGGGKPAGVAAAVKPGSAGAS